MKTYEIESIETQIESIEKNSKELCKENNRTIAELEKKKTELWRSVFESDKDLQKALANLENCEGVDYGLDEGGLYSFVRFDLSDYRDNGVLDVLAECIEFGWVDADNDCICQSHGEDFIAIDADNDGDIYQDNDCIVRASDYETEAERNALIEQWMDKAGFYPDIIEIDRCGQYVGHVETTIKKGEEK